MLQRRLRRVGVFGLLFICPIAGAIRAAPRRGSAGLPIPESSANLAACDGRSAEGVTVSRLLSAAPQTITDIKTFLDACPTTDTAFPQISTDFTLRRNGILVATPSCTPPISTLPIAQWTDELIVLQGLRTIYYMDRGGMGHLPWTPGSLYDWMKSKIEGIDIRDGSGSFCCLTYAEGLYIAVGAQNDFNRDFDRGWTGISGNIGLYAHETRHVDGFSHSSCCGITGGCDDVFDPNDLSAYGTQWWLNMLWLEGGINVGWGCLSPPEVLDISSWHLGSTNTFRDRFCTNQPAPLEQPSAPGGGCVPSDIFSDGFESGDTSHWSAAVP